MHTDYLDKLSASRANKPSVKRPQNYLKTSAQNIAIRLPYLGSAQKPSVKEYIAEGPIDRLVFSCVTAHHSNTLGVSN